MALSQRYNKLAIIIIIIIVVVIIGGAVSVKTVMSPLRARTLTIARSVRPMTQPSKKNCARRVQRAVLGRDQLGRKLCEYQIRFAVYCVLASFEVKLGGSR